MATAGAKVIVASKLPHSVILHVDEPHEVLVQTTSGARTVTEYRKGRKQVTVRGNAYPVNAADDFMLIRPRPEMVGGYALTYGVDKSFWDAWLAQRKDDPMVVNNIIFAREKVEDIRAKCREHKDVRSGLEPIKPDGDPRAPQRLGGVVQVKPAESVPAEAE